ncbi:TIGR03905 family TSCPD domain-containing protein [Ruminococcus sp. NK3A76]|uniref:TIGR03905 family TSCPD domain-containing protein n=1 Tax=Ruminococcus sp. NK3A76 TaxID=877411 RepID=UPI00048B8621|nr:TIGR03905 family TSCPD domain-containing protein [Ruminococcus sp. NK3A76]
MTYSFIPSGVCSRMINIELDENGVIEKVQFIGGCNGNTSGISQLVKGMQAEDVISRLKDIDCNGKGTSCPAQLAIALEQALEEI